MSAMSFASANDHMSIVDVTSSSSLSSDSTEEAASAVGDAVRSKSVPKTDPVVRDKVMEKSSRGKGKPASKPKTDIPVQPYMHVDMTSAGSGSSDKGASAVADKEREKRVPESAVGDQVQEKPKKRKRVHWDLSGGSASVAATCGRTSPPFEDESQEGQLRGTLRAACREHVRDGGAPPIAQPVKGLDSRS